MTPDELQSISTWFKKYQGWFYWALFCVLMSSFCYIMYKNPPARVAAHHHGHGKPGALVMAYIFALAAPGLPVVCAFVLLIVRVNNRIARFRLRKQDSIARLTKQHEKTLRKIRKLEHEVSERTEDLPPETIPVTMRSDD